MDLPDQPDLLESRAEAEGEATALCSGALRTTSGNDIGQTPRLLLSKCVRLV